MVTWKSDSASSRNASKGSSVRSSSSISSTGAPALLRRHRLEQRPADQELLGEQLLGQRLAVGGAHGLGGADRHHLRREVPLVDRRGAVEPFVALQPDQPASQRLGQRLGDLGLADPGLALEEQRPPELQREEHHGRKAPPGDVARAPEQRLGRVDRGGQGAHCDLSSGRRHMAARSGGNQPRPSAPAVRITGAPSPPRVARSGGACRAGTTAPRGAQRPSTGARRTTPQRARRPLNPSRTARAGRICLR